MKSESTQNIRIKVTPSHYSHTAFKIKREKTGLTFPQNIDKRPARSQKIQNYNPSKRETSNDEETTKHQSMMRKQINKQNSLIGSKKEANQLNVSALISLIKEQDQDFFRSQQKSLSQQTDHNSIKNGIIFPNKQLPQLKEFRNQLLTRNIEIMSNKNQKISIPIHEGLYKSNTSHRNENFKQYSQIPNLCDFRMKNQYSESIEFVREYKNGYTPIEMQKKNNDEIQNLRKNAVQSPSKTNKDKSRNHFIRKQQSNLSLPRTCGVSYIKPSESILTQKQPFEPLPPLIFQGSTCCSISSTENFTLILDPSKKLLIDKLILSLENSWLPFIASDQDQMRELLLGKKTKNAKIGFIHGFQNLWPLFAEGSFVLVIFSPQKMTKQSQVWEVFEKKLTYFKIGILSKKSTSGKKAFLKSIKQEASDHLSNLSFDTNNDQLKNELKNQNIQLEKSFGSQESKRSIDLKDSPEEERKTSAFQLLEQQLKGSKAIITMGLRLQMYVEEIDWKEKFKRQDKDFLNGIIISLKQKLEKKSIKIICERLELAKSTKTNHFDEKLDFLRIETSFKGKQLPIELKGLVCKQQRTPQFSSFRQLQNENFLQLSQEQKKKFMQSTTPCSPCYFLNNVCTEQSWKKSLRFPLYYIGTRDSFAFDLIEQKTILRRQNGRQYTRIDYFFYPDNVPANFGSEYRRLFPKLDVGVTAFHGFFTDQQLKKFEDKTFEMEKNAFRNKFAQMTVQPSIVSTKIKRTKFFFGYRYMWTRCQLSEPCSYVGAGVRKDVASPPQWTKQISDQMVKENIVEKNFINSIAINVYHDGKQGLAQHFDDAVRFKQPIYTLRLFSDARLSFGSQFYGFCNGAFIIPLPRGCILVMEENSYAANGVKHCVRPCDMTGKSAAVILRQMHSQVVSQASKYDELIDFPTWLSSLSENENSITFAQQKRLEAEDIMRQF